MIYIKIFDRMNNYFLFTNAIYALDDFNFSYEEKRFWTEYFSSLRMLFNVGRVYDDEQIDEIGDRIQKELIKRYNYDEKYVVLTYCDIIESCFNDEEKELNATFLKELRDQFKDK